MRFDCIPPEFSPFRNFKKNIGKLNSLAVRKKKKKIPTDRPNFQILVGWGQHNFFFFFGLMDNLHMSQIHVKYYASKAWQFHFKQKTPALWIWFASFAIISLFVSLLVHWRIGRGGGKRGIYPPAIWLLPYVVSWEPEGHYQYSKTFCWEPEGHCCSTIPMVIVSFWFSTEHLWILIAPFWLSTDELLFLWVWLQAFNKFSSFGGQCHFLVGHMFIITQIRRSRKGTKNIQGQLVIFFL